MKSIFEYTDYKKYLRDFLEVSRPKVTLKVIADHLKIHPSRATQVMRGKEDFSFEQGYALTRRLGIKAAERDYFLNLLHKQRAGSIELEDYYENILSDLRMQNLKVNSRIIASTELSESVSFVYYSDWLYQAARLLCDTGQVASAEDICDHLHSDSKRTHDVLAFLVEVGLCEKKNGRIVRTPKNTHVKTDSIFVTSHHRNWRIKALEYLSCRNPENLSFTSPMIIDKKSAEQIKKIILESLTKIDLKISEAESKGLYCLNLDFINLLTVP